MKDRLTRFGVLAVVCMTACFLYGCSDDAIRTVISQDDYIPALEETSFLPLTEGYTIIYRLTQANGSSETVTIEIGQPVQLGSISAYEWFSDSRAVRDTGYVRVTTDAIFFYDGASGQPEKILGFPLVAGNSWLRFSESYNDAGRWEDNADRDNDSVSVPDRVSAKVFPSTGANVMTVVGEEQLQLSNGDVLSHTIKVYNESTTPGKKNYYWYARNVGLVKYIIGTTDAGYPRADITGELIDFGM